MTNYSRGEPSRATRTAPRWSAFSRLSPVTCSCSPTQPTAGFARLAADTVVSSVSRQSPARRLVLHSARKKLGITINEYCLTDTIHKLSSNRSSVPGWCFASKDHLAKILGVSRRSIHNILTNLKKREIVEAQEDTGYLRTTELWRQAVEVVKARVFGDG